MSETKENYKMPYRGIMTNLIRVRKQEPDALSGKSQSTDSDLTSGSDLHSDLDDLIGHLQFAQSWIAVNHEDEAMKRAQMGIGDFLKKHPNDLHHLRETNEGEK